MLTNRGFCRGRMYKWLSTHILWRVQLLGTASHETQKSKRFKPSRGHFRGTPGFRKRRNQKFARNPNPLTNSTLRYFRLSAGFGTLVCFNKFVSLACIRKSSLKICLKNVYGLLTWPRTKWAVELITWSPVQFYFNKIRAEIVCYWGTISKPHSW